MKIGILITTIERDNLLFKCLVALDKNWNEDYFVVVIDQGNPSKEKDDFWHNLKNVKGEYLKTKYDIGALEARNIGIKLLHLIDIPYVLMSADSIILTEKYDFNKTIEFLEKEDNRFLCGFDIKNRIPWECDLEKKDKFYLDIPRREKVDGFQPVDLCRNFFLAKTDLFINCLYDEDRKLADHESFFYRCQQKGYKCFYNNTIQSEYIDEKPVEYKKLRNRFNQYRNEMIKKYDLKGWVAYSDDLIKKFNLWRNDNG